MSTGHRPRLLLAGVAASVLVVGASITGCTKGTESSTKTSTPPSTRRLLPIDFSQPGPYRVGVLELNITPTPSGAPPTGTGPVASTPDASAPPASGPAGPPSADGAAPTATSSTDPAAPGEAGATTTTSPGTEPAPNGTATRRAAVFYPADAGSPGQYQKIEGYRTDEAFPAAVRPSVPPEIVQTVKFDALRDPPANREGPFPVVIHSHGENGFYLFEARHLHHLASWGFVVAAPDHQERSLASLMVPTTDAPAVFADQDITDLRNTLNTLRSQNLLPGGRLQGALNLDQVAAEGFSAGGRAAAVLASEPAVKTFIGMAPSPALDSADAPRGLPIDLSVDGVTAKLAERNAPPKPSMVIASDQDSIIPLDVVRAEYEWLSTKVAATDPEVPKTLAVLENAGHQAYVDLCAPIRARGGLSQYAGRYPGMADYFARSENGCLPENLDPDRGYAVVNHLTVAQLRWVFRLDDSRVSLDPAFLDKTFPDTLETIIHRGPAGS